MVDLFRYIEHDFAIPAAADAIDTANDSDFQTSLGEAAARASEGGDPRAAGRARGTTGGPVAVRGLPRGVLPVPDSRPNALGDRLEALTTALGSLDSVTSTTVEAAVVEAFGRSSGQVVAGDDFAADRALLENSVVAVKLSTGFDRADAARLVRQLRALALLETLAADDSGSLDRAALEGLLQRPVRVPSTLLAALADATHRRFPTLR